MENMKGLTSTTFRLNIQSSGVGEFTFQWPGSIVSVILSLILGNDPSICVVCVCVCECACACASECVCLGVANK